MFRPTLRRLQQYSTSPKNIREGRPLITNPYLIYNPYQTKRKWPPDLTKLTQQEQLRYQKKFTKRAKLLEQASPHVSRVKLAQFVTVTGILIWAIFFAQFDDNFIPFYTVGLLLFNSICLSWLSSHPIFNLLEFQLRKEVYSWFGVEIHPHPEYKDKRPIITSPRGTLNTSPDEDDIS